MTFMFSLLIISLTIYFHVLYKKNICFMQKESDALNIAGFKMVLATKTITSTCFDLIGLLHLFIHHFD